MRHFLLSATALALLSWAGAASAAASPESKACSDQATAKGLHGAERETFRDACLKASAPAAAVKTAAVKTAAVVPAAMPAAAPKAANGASAASKACSDQATAKGLHGADRETFRNACLKGAPAAMPTAAAAPRPAPMAMPAPATRTVTTTTTKSPASKACSDQADARGLHGAERETFRNTCLKGAAPVAAALPKPVAKSLPAPIAVAPIARPAPVATTKTAAVPVAVPPEPGSPAARTPRTPGARSPAQLAADQRITACGQQWQAAKAAGKIPAGQKWPQYWSACSVRMKAA